MGAQKSCVSQAEEQEDACRSRLKQDFMEDLFLVKRHFRFSVGSSSSFQPHLTEGLMYGGRGLPEPVTSYRKNTSRSSCHHATVDTLMGRRSENHQLFGGSQKYRREITSVTVFVQTKADEKQMNT